MNRLESMVWVGLLSFVFAACGSDDGTGPGTTVHTGKDYVGSVSSGSVAAEYQDAAIPAGSATAPSVSGSGQIVRSGSIVLEMVVDATATELYVGVKEAQRGYYRLDLQQLAPAKTEPITYYVNVTAAARVKNGTFTVVCGWSNGDTPSALTNHEVSVNEVATVSDKLQVSLNWSQPVDMDLHVEVPGNVDIYYGNTQGPSGEELDLDSNAACSIDGVNNENITWFENQPAVGTYTVRVNLWSACDQPGPFPYVVTVSIAGQPTVYEGEFAANEAFPGTAFDGRQITQFTLTAAAKPANP